MNNQPSTTDRLSIRSNPRSKFGARSVIVRWSIYGITMALFSYFVFPLVPLPKTLRNFAAQTPHVISFFHMTSVIISLFTPLVSILLLSSLIKLSLTLLPKILNEPLSLQDVITAITLAYVVPMIAYIVRFTLSLVKNHYYIYSITSVGFYVGQLRRFPMSILSNVDIMDIAFWLLVTAFLSLFSNSRFRRVGILTGSLYVIQILIISYLS